MITLINTRQGFADRKTASGFCIDTIKRPSSGFLVMSEIFKDVKGYEGLYQVSTLGRVKSLVGRYGIIERIMKQTIRGGYMAVPLSISKRVKLFSVHRLVAITFIHNSENKPQVNHKDGNKLNNVVDNLEWNTCSENINHSVRLGFHVDNKGEKHGMTKFTNNDIINIKIHLKNKTKKQIDLANEYGVTHQTISSIKMGRNWKHIKL